MKKERMLNDVKFMKECFNRSTRVLTEDHSSYRPTPEMLSVAGQVAHVAVVTEWFIDGATKPSGFDMNFAEHDAQANAVKSLAAARKQLDKAFARLTDFIQSNTQEYLDAPMSAGPLMIGEPRNSIVVGIIEHTSHHRGALTVYSRTLGLVPVMPYMDPQPA